MYKLIYKLKAENRIKDFIKSYKETFLNTFTDTGLFYEDLIKENYRNKYKINGYSDFLCTGNSSNELLMI